ncbi:hypothetical protein JKF63_04423 [Porcisia hertigi]|uniref:Uncharacterized protein n=1 Tax=Porcisia hertigi TaxID=2761500 RepID=A0A836I5F1_9TRYP|nr:hypothetical protein JKF63_04423 [Porcisia hertigi]
MHGCAPLTTAVSFTSDGWNACAPAHSTWQPPVPSHPLSFSYEAGWNNPSGVPHTPDFTGGGGGVLPYLWSEPCVTHIDPALPPATLSINNICNVVPPRQVDGTSSVLGDIPAPPVLPSVAVFAGGAQEAFWRRSCLRVTCVPVLRSFDRDDDDGLPEVSSDAPPVVSLGKGEDTIRSSSSSGSGSHITGGVRVEGLDELVWRWLDTLGMTDAVEDVVFPGAGRVLVLWTSGLTREPNSRGCGEGGDSWISSTPGERLGQLLALRGGGGERRDSAVLDAPREVVFDAMRLLLD